MKKKWRPLDAANKIIHHYITNIKGIARGYAATRSFLIYTNTDTR
jgi:hypothetical protein